MAEPNLERQFLDFLQRRLPEPVEPEHEGALLEHNEGPRRYFEAGYRARDAELDALRAEHAALRQREQEAASQLADARAGAERDERALRLIAAYTWRRPPARGTGGGVEW